MVSITTNFPRSLDVLNQVSFKDTAFAFNKDLLDCKARKYTSHLKHHTKYLDDLLFQKCDLKWAVGLLT